MNVSRDVYKKFQVSIYDAHDGSTDAGIDMILNYATWRWHGQFSVAQVSKFAYRCKFLRYLRGTNKAPLVYTTLQDVSTQPY